LSDNQLERLPIEIGRLNNLQELNLNGNRLIQVPPEIRAIPGIEIYE